MKKTRCWLRRSVALVLVQTCLLAVAWSQARAVLQEKLLSMGSGMMLYSEARRQDRPRTLRINGQALQLATGSTGRSVAEVLDHFELQCRRRSGRVWQGVQALHGAAAKAMRHVSPQLLDLTWRSHSLTQAERGFVACLDTGESRLPLEELMHRLRRFLASGDLSALGHLRYVQAERGRHATSFAALWSDGPLPLTTMFPARGDVPGSDLPEVPRPPGSQRLLVVEEAGEPLQLRVYRANGAAGRQGKTSVAAWANAYRSFLYSAGWRSSPAVTPTMAESTPSAQTWLAENSRQTKRSQRTLLVTAGQSSDRRPFVLLAVHPLADRDFVP